ncbi:MAG TPA: hypothetical protein P5161_05965, partial [Eubacteriales bacterium]|nr:hypothetical protein [Eubacteriales bacterium]
EKDQVNADAVYINFDDSFYFGLDKVNQGVKKYYELKVKGSICVEDSTKSKMLLEIIETIETAGTTATGLMMGIYLFDNNILVDLAGISGQKYLIEIDDIDFTALFVKIKDVWDNIRLKFELLGSEFDATGIMDLLLQFADLNVGDILAGLNLPLGGDMILKGIIATLLFNEGLVYDMGGGVQRVVMPGANITGLLGAVMEMVVPMISDDINLIVDKLLGWDIFAILEALKTLSIDLRFDTKDGVFLGMGLDAKVQGDNPLGISMGINYMDSSAAPIIVFPEFNLTDLRDFSFTTLSLNAEMTIVAKEHIYTLASMLDSLGSLAGGINIGGALLEKEIRVAEGKGSAYFNLELIIRGAIDLKDNNNTEIYLELKGSGVQRLGAYYVGSDETLYIDMTGLGAGKFKISYLNGEPLNLTNLILGVIDNLFESLMAPNIGAAGASVATALLADVVEDETAPADKRAFAQAMLDAFFTYATPDDPELAAALGYNKTFSEQLAEISADEEEETTDIFDLIIRILNEVEIERGTGLLFLESINAFLTRDVINEITGLISPGLTLPITSVDISVDSEGTFGLNSLGIIVNIGTDEPGPNGE